MLAALMALCGCASVPSPAIPGAVFLNVAKEGKTDSPVPTRVTLSGLSQCAKRFLRLEVTTLDIVEQCGETIPNGDIQRLALRLLERSLPLRAEYEQTDGFPRASHRDQFDFSARSH